MARHGTPQRPDDLLEHRCLNFTIRTLWNSWTFHEDDTIKFIDIPSFIGADQGELLRTLALVGLGVVRLAEFHIAEDLKRGTLVPLLKDFQERTDDDRFYLLYPRGRVQAPRVKAVIDFLHRQLR
ncbi:LysR substrate-binding domain-containing protein [Pseudoroseomonas wenyumeiae]